MLGSARGFMVIGVMKKTLLTIALLGAAQITFAATPSKKGDDPVAMTKWSLESSLKDPSSVQYKNVGIITKKAGTKTVCGEYNAKNSYGGYVGFKRFLAPASNFFLLEANVDTETWIKLCMTDENEAMFNAARASVAAKAAAEKEELRTTRRENIERTCAEKRQAIDEVGGPDVQAKKDGLAQSCADLITKSNAN